MGVPDSLARLPLFEDLTEEELSLLMEHLSTRRLAAGETLFTEGESARECFILLDGRIADAQERTS